MSKVNGLIKKICVDVVEYKSLNEVFTLFSGMTGVTNKWAEEGNCHFIDYMNAYKNNKIDITKLPYATVKNTKQTTLIQGDLLLTSASELPDECAIASVIEDKIQDGIFMDDHLFGLRLKDEYKKILNTTFVSYYLNSKPFRCNLFKAVRGVTRFYISNKDYMKLTIPIPPIDVQKEIVRILDKFGELEVELKAELEARKSQYEFWRSKIINMYESENIKLSDMAKVYDGIHSTPNYQKNGIPFISVENISNIYGSNKFISKEDYMKYKIKPEINDVFMTRIGTIGKCSVFEKQIDLAYYVSLALIRPNTKIILPKYLKYVIESNIGKDELYKRTLVHAVPIKVNKDEIGKIVLPVPSIEDQKKIISKLDRFESLTESISVGLPAEIELRRKQYEYYRNKLLNFKEL